MINVRQYTPSDREAVIALWSEVFGNPTDHNAPEDSLDRKVDHCDGLLYVADNGQEVIGTVMGGYDGHRGWVYSLAVHPDFRRQGIATQLMGRLEGELQARGCPKLNFQARHESRRLAFLRKPRLPNGNEN